MKKIVIVIAIFLWMASTANADTYMWTDDKGVVSFTDDISLVPLKYRAHARKRADITIHNPLVQQELKEQEKKAMDELNRPRITSTPDSLPSPQQAPAVETTKPVADELPPGRTKSQRILDNIKNRETGDK